MVPAKWTSTRSAVLLDGRVAGGAHRGLLPCDVDLIRGGERPVTLSFVRVPRPRHRAHQFRSPAQASKALRPDPYAVSAKSSSGRTFRSASPSTNSRRCRSHSSTSTWVMSSGRSPPPAPRTSPPQCRHNSEVRPRAPWPSHPLGRPSWCLPRHCSRSSRPLLQLEQSCHPVHQPVEVPGTTERRRRPSPVGPS